MQIVYTALEVVLAPIMIVNFSICFLGAMAVLGLNFDSPLLLQLVALGLGIVAWVMNAGTGTMSAQRPLGVRLAWPLGMPFSIAAVFLYVFSIPTGTDFSLEIIRRPMLVAQRPVNELIILTAFAIVIAVSPMAFSWLDIRRRAIARK
jgi:hypothetical protein